jgi:hypothetical protein
VIQTDRKKEEKLDKTNKTALPCDDVKTDTNVQMELEMQSNSSVDEDFRSSETSLQSQATVKHVGLLLQRQNQSRSSSKSSSSEVRSSNSEVRSSNSEIRSSSEFTARSSSSNETVSEKARNYGLKFGQF